MNPHAATKAGKSRQPYRIREFLAENDLSMKSVAERVGISLTVVRDTVIGVRNNRRVLVYLQDLGCPEAFLSMPKKKEKPGISKPFATNTNHEERALNHV